MNNTVNTIEPSNSTSERKDPSSIRDSFIRILASPEGYSGRVIKSAELHKLKPEDGDFSRDKFNGAVMPKDAVKISKNDVMSEVVQHRDTAEPEKIEKVEPSEQFNQCMELIKKFWSLQVKLSKAEGELETAKDERKEFYNSDNALGKQLLNDHRMERTYVALEAEVGKSLQGMIGLRQDIVQSFESVQDTSERTKIYDELRQNPDELGLSHEILNNETREIYAENHEVKSKVPEPVSEPEVEPELALEDKVESKDDENMIPGVEVDGQGNGDTEVADDAPVLPTVPPDIESEEKVEIPKPLAEAEITAPVATEVVAEVPHPPLVDMEMIGADGLPKLEVAEPKSFELDRELTTNTTEQAPIVPSTPNPVDQIRNRMGLGSNPATQPETVPPLHNVGPLDILPTAPEAPILPPVDNSTTKEIATPAMPIVEKPIAQPIVQNFIQEPERKGFWGLFKRGNNTAPQVSTEEIPLDRHGSVQNIANRGKELDASHIANIEEALSPEDKAVVN